MEGQNEEFGFSSATCSVETYMVGRCERVKSERSLRVRSYAGRSVWTFERGECLAGMEECPTWSNTRSDDRSAVGLSNTVAMSLTEKICFAVTLSHLKFG